MCTVYTIDGYIPVDVNSLDESRSRPGILTLNRSWIGRVWSVFPGVWAGKHLTRLEGSFSSTFRAHPPITWGGTGWLRGNGSCHTERVASRHTAVVLLCTCCVCERHKDIARASHEVNGRAKTRGGKYCIDHPAAYVSRNEHIMRNNVLQAQHKRHHVVVVFLIAPCMGKRRISRWWTGCRVSGRPLALYRAGAYGSPNKPVAPRMAPCRCTTLHVGDRCSAL